MRVLTVGNMYPPHHLGGYELMWRDAVRALRERGHQARVLTSDHREPRSEGAPDEAGVHRELRWYWREHEFPRLGLGERRRIELHNLTALERHLVPRPDVVTWWAMGGMSLSLLERVRSSGIPAVGFVHDEWLVYGPLVDGWQRAISRLGPAGPRLSALAGVAALGDLGSAARWIFNSETMRAHARAAGLKMRRSGVAHPGIDPALFRPGRPQPWRNRLLYAGRIDPRKGIATAIRALAGLPEATLEVLGGGDPAHLAELRALAARLGVEARVGFSELPRERLRDAYAGADALLFPVAWEEPWGLVPLEAMAVGTPVVATGAGGSGEYLRDEENCLLFEPRDDPAALAGQVASLAADPELRARLRAGGLETAARFPQAAFTDAVVASVEAAARSARATGSTPGPSISTR